MAYVTSRGRDYKLPTHADEMSEDPWFNMWERKLWPYKEVVQGDVLYWYDSTRQSIVWKTHVTKIDKFRYTSKSEAARRIEERLGRVDRTQRYYVEARAPGYCVAFAVRAVRRLNLPKPPQLRFPQQGWLAVNDQLAETWLTTEDIHEGPTLDDITKQEDPLEALTRANDLMAQVSPQKRRSILQRTIRQDTLLIRTLKKLCDFRCQWPNCGVRIPKRGGGFYIEVAHIEPVHSGGRSVLGNLLVLCPNHHKELDYGHRVLHEQTVDRVRGRLNGMEFDIRFPLKSGAS